ncbi:MAG TPA: outer membrane beta-barrel protein [Beijerinckiaceae bacterium]|jgi:opacity protein-like surface antigen
MGVVKALVAAGLVAAAYTSSAVAADLLPPPPPLASPAAVVAPDFSGWYLRGDVGVGASFAPKSTSTFAPGLTPPGFGFYQSDLADAAFVGLGVGYRFNSWLRFDVTGEYRGSAKYHAINAYGTTDASNTCSVGPRCFDVYHGMVKGGVLLANAYVDLGTWAGVTPFVGVGLGGSMNRMTNFYDHNPTTGGFGIGITSTKYRFAWAVMAGLSYAVTQNVSLELGYRYLDRGEGETRLACFQGGACAGERQHYKVGSHDLRLGMRWMFADSYMPAPSPEPLVRKY